MSSFNMKNLTNALAKTAGVIEKTVKTTVQDVTGPKALQEFELLNQIGSAGPGLAWKLFSARSGRDSTRLQHRHYPVVCVWVLDKRALSRAGLSKAAEDSFLDLIRADATRLVRIRHPGVLHVVQALDETKNAMAMVTEPLFASVANALGNLDNVPEVPNELKGVEMGLLEVKHGLLQIAETLDFVHNNAHLIHRAIAPENILITSSGAWKLGGFSFAITVDKYVSNFTNVQAFHYAEYDAEDSLLPLQPSLNYTAPELTRNEGSSIGCSSDIFSFGCLAYHLIARKPLFDCRNNLKMYMNTLQYLSSEAFSSVPNELVADLRRMLSATESTRPTAIDFTASPFFRDDTRLRALRFLDHMLGRDNMQKSEFLKALADMWKDFDSRVLRYKVLGPLCAELRNVVMQPMILPMVLTIAESQDKNDFELSTLPALLPVLGTASGETLLLLVKKADLIINKTSVNNLVSDVLPMLVRAYDDSDARIQEEVLKKSASLAKQLDSQLVKQAILPRVHGLALKTTIAAVRVNALLCLSELVHTLDKQGVLIVLQTIHRCTAVDRSAPTLMCTLGIANSILKQFGIEFSAEHVLPLVTPLLNAQQLNNQQFTKYMLFVKDVLRKIEEKRGVVVTDSGIPEVKASDAIQSLELSNKSGGNVAASTKSSPSWDEDWVTTSKGPTTSVQPSKTPDVSSPLSSISVPVVPINQPTQVTSSMPPPSFPSSTQQAPPTCTPVDIEWPPRAPPSGSPRLDNNEKQTTNDNSSFDDIDPFATWPLGPPGSGTCSNGTSGSCVNNYGFNSVSSSVNSTNSQANSDSWAFNTQGSLNELGQNHGGSAINTATLNSGGLDSQDPFKSLTQNQTMSSSDNTENKMGDIGSIFATNKSDEAALRLAPPPSTATGRGRGRGRGRGAANSKSQSQQPPLLDLL